MTYAGQLKPALIKPLLAFSLPYIHSMCHMLQKNQIRNIQEHLKHLLGLSPGSFSHPVICPMEADFWHGLQWQQVYTLIYQESYDTGLRREKKLWLQKQKTPPSKYYLKYFFHIQKMSDYKISYLDSLQGQHQVLCILLRLSPFQRNKTPITQSPGP